MAYFNGIIKEEYDAIDPEEPEYDYVFEACEKALNANPENARAYYYMAMVYNKQVEYDLGHRSCTERPCLGDRVDLDLST